ncbi:MAG: hypothetical protein MUE73_03440 [Planctomycetes bacterium]|jgi:hypothetical protein|nr:hypothetical protein [Planctomycetota bacterium]
MKKGAIALGAAAAGVLVLLAFLLGVFSARRTPAKLPPPAAPAVEKREWSTDDIASDPEGYLAWADANIAIQIKGRREMLERISGSRVQWEERKQKVVGDLPEVESFLKRLNTAVRRAEDEGRWPVQVGNRKFERDKALRLLAELPRQIDLRKPLEREYDKTLAAMDDRSKQLSSDIVALGHLREKIALDVERARLSRGVDELTKLSRSSQEIASFTSLLATDVNTAPPPAVGGEDRIVDLDTLLR